MTDGLVLGALFCLAALAVARAAMLSARGVRILAIDRERSVVQGLADLGFALCFLAWCVETVAFALPLHFHLVPLALQRVVLDAAVFRVAGVLALAAGLGVYALALRDLGRSWRIGIDRDRAGELVTVGIYARSRNPIYLGLVLVASGSFLVLGRLVLLLLLGVFIVYFRRLVRREEEFLLQHYGDAYRAYVQRVGRWWR